MTVMPAMRVEVPSPVAARFHEKLTAGLAKRFHVLNPGASGLAHVRRRLVKCKSFHAEMEGTYRRRDSQKIIGSKAIDGEALLFINLANPADEALEVDSFLMSMETEERLLEVDESGTQDDLDDLVERLCLKIENKYPLLKASVAEAEESKVLLSAGSSRGATVGMKLWFYRALGVPTGAELLKQYQAIPARGRIVETGDARSRSEVTPAKHRKSVDTSCFAIAK